MDLNTILYAIIILMLFYVGYVLTMVLKKQSGLIKDTSEIHNMLKSNFEVSKDIFNPEIVQNVVNMHKENWN